MTFQALFEYSSIGIIISNRAGIILKSNLFAAKIFGYDKDQLNGQQIEILIPPSLREKHSTYRQHYNENPLPRTMGSNLNLMAVKKSGELFPVEISLSYFETDGVRQIVSFVNDITERQKSLGELKKISEELEFIVKERTKELSDALLEINFTNKGLEQEMERRKKVEEQIRGTLAREKELNELKTRFVSMASHEFRTPLSGILTSVSLIARYNRMEDEPKREKHIQTIKRSVKNLTNILNDFLSLDKLEQGKIESHPSAFVLIDEIETIVEEIQDFSGKGQKIIIENKCKDLTLYQDKEMFRNILVNLLSNAIKYSAAESTICLRTSISNSQLNLQIQDEGIGIPKKDQKHLFESFFRAQNVSTVQGTGLGLNIVNRYLELMGGNIEFTSEENVGTTFSVFLPLEKKL